MPRRIAGVVFFTVLAIATAQTPDDSAPPRPSHRAIDSPLSYSSNPERDLASRLSGARASKERLEEMLRDSEVQKLVQALLKDPQFLQSMQSQLPPDKLNELAQRLQRGENLPQLRGDPALERLLRGTLKNAPLQAKQREQIEKWLAKNPPLPPFLRPQPLPGAPPVPPRPPIPPDREPTEPRPSPTPAPTPPTRSDDHTPAWLRERLRQWNNEINRMIRSDPQGWRDFFKRLAENKQGGEKLVQGTLESARGLGKMLPKFGNLVPRGMAMPTLPRVGVPRLAPAALPSATSLSSLAQGILFVLVALIVGVLLWRCGRWFQSTLQARREEWRLGPWPVAIAAIQTREQLVQAFEYLALLCLGRAARTRHHRDLAQQLAAMPDRQPQERAEAARELAELYAIARYAPQGHLLTPAELEQARRDLRRLAGEAA